VQAEIGAYRTEGYVNIEGRIENQLLDWPVGDPSGISGTNYRECSIKGMNRRRGEAERERQMPM